MPTTPARGVLLIIADDWSPIAGCYGNDVIHTPNIDALAARSTTFDHAFCGSPSCSVSRATLLTGHHSHTHGQYGHCAGVHHFRTHEHLPTIPRLLKAIGGRSACIGKKHVAPDAVYPFDVYEDDQASAVRFSREFLAGRAAAFLDTVADDQPFYLHVAPMYPHRRFEGFGEECFPEQFDDVTYDPADVIVPAYLPDTQQTREQLASYYRAITRYDACVGSILESLQKSGRADNTLVIVMSDHGMPFPGAKATFYEGGHHCPLIVHNPSSPQDKQHTNALVNWLDIAPTVYDWLGVTEDHWQPDKLGVPAKAPGAIDGRLADLPGRSLLPILDQAEPAGFDEITYSHCFHALTQYYPYRVLRGRRYKLVQNLAHHLPMPVIDDTMLDLAGDRVGSRDKQALYWHQPEELYDLEADPAETRNVIDDPALADVATGMRDRLNAYRKATKDPWKPK